MDMSVPDKASAAEAAGWRARINGERDMPPKQFQSNRDDCHGWLRGWDMAENRIKYAAWKR